MQKKFVPPLCVQMEVNYQKLTQKTAVETCLFAQNLVARTGVQIKIEHLKCTVLTLSILRTVVVVMNAHVSVLCVLQKFVLMAVSHLKLTNLIVVET